MPHGHENECPRASAFLLDAFNHRHLLDSLAHSKRLLKPQPTSGPHSTWMLHRRQEAPSLRMAVRSKLRLAGEWIEQRPMETGWDWILILGKRIIPVQCGVPGGDAIWVDPIGLRDLPPDPLTQIDCITHFPFSN